METESDLKQQLLLFGGMTTDTFEEFELNFEPLDDGIYKTYKFDHSNCKFVEYKNEEFDKKILEYISQDKYDFILQKIINKQENFNFPSFWLRFFATVLFLIIIVFITVVLTLIWTILILDLVFFSFAILLMKRLVILLWVLRVWMINLGYFTNLKKVLKGLNKEYENRLVWTFNATGKLLKVKIVEGHNSNTNY